MNRDVGRLLTRRLTDDRKVLGGWNRTADLVAEYGVLTCVCEEGTCSHQQEQGNRVSFRNEREHVKGNSG
jgi:hypothetical protein